MRSPELRERARALIIDENRSLLDAAEELGISKQLLVWIMQEPEWPQGDFIVGQKPLGTRRFGPRDQETAVWMVKGIGLEVKQVAWLFNRTPRCIRQWMRRFPDPQPPDNIEELLDV